MQGASNEYPQHMFLRRNKRNTDILGLKKVPYQQLQQELHKLCIICPWQVIRCSTYKDID